MSMMPKIGSVFVVPVDGYYGAVLYLGSFGRFGDAFGLFFGLWSVEQIACAGWAPEVIRLPVFTDRPDRIVAHREDLVGRFDKPGILYDPNPNPDPDYHVPAFGLIEYVDGARRVVTREEAERLFLFKTRSGQSIQCPSARDIIDYLRKHCRPELGAKYEPSSRLEDTPRKQPERRSDPFAEWMDIDPASARRAKAAMAAAKVDMLKLGKKPRRANVKKVVKAFVESLNQLAPGIDSVRREQMTDVAIELAESAGVDSEQAFDWVEEFRDF